MRFLIPKENFTWNPVTKIPPNFPCPCGSRKKFKKCCSEDIPRYISKERLADWTELYDLAGAGFRAW